MPPTSQQDDEEERPGRWSPARAPGQTDAQVYAAFFQLCPENVRICYCNICFKTPDPIKLGGGGGIHNFKRHLWHCHPEFLTKEDRDTQRRNPHSSQKRARLSKNDGATFRKIDEVFGCSSDSDLVDNLARLVACGGLPLRFVSSPALHSFLDAQGIAEQDELPGRKAIAARINRIYESAMKDIAGRLNRAMEPLPFEINTAALLKLRNCCSVTLDEWTSTGVKPYMSTTIHFIDENWRLQSFPIACSPLPHPHTTPNLRQALQQNLDSVVAAGYEDPGLAVHELVGIVTDGARNVMGITNDSPQQRMRCVAHGIQLALANAAERADFNEFMKPVSCYYAALAKSSQRRERLACELRARNLPVLMPIYPVKTRWNSHYDALRRFVDIKPALDAIPVEELGISFSLDVYDLIAHSTATFIGAPYVLETLEPFVRWTSLLSANSSVTISLVPRAVNELWNLAKCAITAGGSRANMANKLRIELKEQLWRVFRDVLEPPLDVGLPLVHLARFLDPRTVNEVILRSNQDDMENGRPSAMPTAGSVAMVKRILADLKKRLPRKQETTELPSWICDDDGDNLADDIEDKELKKVLARDIHKYLEQTAEVKENAEDVDPLEWWKKEAPKFPTLAGFARQYLAVPATSTESERMFSLAGAVVSPMRTRLGPARVNELVVIRSYYLRLKRAEAADFAASAANAASQQNDFLDDGDHFVNEDGYLDDEEELM